MSDRKAELEKKKAKLQAIREEKERRRREKESKDVSCMLKDHVIICRLYLSSLVAIVPLYLLFYHSCQEI